MRQLRWIALSATVLATACGGGSTNTTTSSAFLSGGEDEHYESAIALSRAGDLVGAERELRAAITVNPRYLAAHLALGDLLLGQLRFADARDAYGQAAALRDISIDAHSGLARANLGLSSLESALLHAQRAVTLTDSFTLDEIRSGAFSLLGEVHAARGSQSDAEAAFQQALEVDSTNTYARIELARVYSRSGRMADAIRMLSTAGAFQDDPAVLLRLGALYYDVHLYERAVETLQTAYDAAPNNDDIARYLGAANLRLGRHEIGVQLATSVITRNPAYIDAYPVRGRAELMRGYADRARADAAHVLAIEPTHYDALILAGDVEAADDNAAGAESRYLAARSVDPTNVDAIAALAQLYYQQRRWSDYTATVEPEVDRVDAPSGWREQLVEAFLGAGDTARAIFHRSLLAESRPQDHALHRDVARMALDNPGTLPNEQVLRHARNAFERSGGGTMEYRLLYFDALLLNGMTDDAAAQLEVALRAWPNNPEVTRRRDALRGR
jgi:tetratricopeptide (TPR) repeat protein